MQIQKIARALPFTVSIILLIVFAYITSEKSKENSQLNETQQVLKSNYQTFQKMSMEHLRVNLLSDYQTIGRNMLYGVNKETVDSCCSSYLKGKVALFIPQKSCNVCYDEIYEVLKIGNDSLRVNIEVITDKTKFREVRNNLSMLDLPNRLFYLKDNSYFETIKVEHAPFLVYVDDQLIAKHLFIPLVNHPEFSKQYLLTLNKRYQLSKHSIQVSE